MKFIVAKNEHVDRMCEITGQAKRQLKGLGLDQWQKVIRPERYGLMM